MAVSRGPLRAPRPWETNLPPRSKRASGNMSDALNKTSGDDDTVTIAVPKHLLPNIKRIIQMNASVAQNQNAADNAAADQTTTESVEQLETAVNETESKLNNLRQRLKDRVAQARTAATGTRAKRVFKATGIVAGVAALAGAGYYAYRRYAGA